MMLNSEIPTAIQENAKITVVVFDNAAFGCINNLQMGNGIGSLATEMRHRNEETGKLDGKYCYTDFGKVGEGYGMKAFYAKTPDEFRKAVQDAKKETCSCIIDAKSCPRRWRKAMSPGGISAWLRPRIPTRSRKRVSASTTTSQRRECTEAIQYRLIPFFFFHGFNLLIAFSGIIFSHAVRVQRAWPCAAQDGKSSGRRTPGT